MLVAKACSWTANTVNSGWDNRQLNTGISIASLEVSVITLALVLMLFAGKPGEPSQVELEMSLEINEAQRLATCAAIGDMYHTVTPSISGFLTANDGLIAQEIMDNKCTDEEIGWERPD